MEEIAVAALKAKIKVCMFDQYGTVVDMQKGLTEVVTPYLREKGWDGRPDAFVTWWVAHPLRELHDRRAAP